MMETFQYTISKYDTIVNLSSWSISRIGYSTLSFWKILTQSNLTTSIDFTLEKETIISWSKAYSNAVTGGWHKRIQKRPILCGHNWKSTTFIRCNKKHNLCANITNKIKTLNCLLQRKRRKRLQPMWSNH